MVNEKSHSHYDLFKLQPTDYFYKYNVDIYRAKIIKYICRYPYKHEDKRIDLQKALYTCRLLLERIKKDDVKLKKIDVRYFIMKNFDVLNVFQIAVLFLLSHCEIEKAKRTIEGKIDMLCVERVEIWKDL